MGVYLAAILIGVPGIIFLIFSYTPKGKRWMRANGLLWFIDTGDSPKSSPKRSNIRRDSARSPGGFRIRWGFASKNVTLGYAAGWDKAIPSTMPAENMTITATKKGVYIVNGRKVVVR